MNKYGSNEQIDSTYKPIRGILTDLGYGNEEIGYDPKTKSVLLRGKPLKMSGMTAGADQHWYADPTAIQNDLYASGSKPTVPQYTNPYQNQMNGAVKQFTDYMQKGFKYNPSKDSGLKQAQGVTEQRVSESAAKRGMLYGDDTKAIIAQETAKLIPQYEQIAYGQWMDEGERLLGFANFFQNLSDKDYQQFKDKWDMDVQSKALQRQERLDAIDFEQKKLDNAYKKLGEQDYVDNEISKITGLPVGMLSSEAKKRLEDREWQIETEKRREEAEIRQLSRQVAKEKEIIDYRAKNGDGMGLGNSQQRMYYANAYKYLLSQNGNDANKALQALLLDKEYADPNNSMGPELYKQLVNDFKTLAQAQTQGESKSTDYKTDPDFAANVKYINEHPDTALQDIQDNAEQLIQDYGIDGYNELVKKATPKE